MTGKDEIELAIRAARLAQAALALLGVKDARTGEMILTAMVEQVVELDVWLKERV